MGSPGEFAVLDVETTGFVPGEHRVVEIAVVRVTAEGRVLGELETLINPERKMGATRVHGLKGEHVAQAPLFRDVAGAVLELLRGAVLVAHNAGFDLRFLRHECELAGIPLPAELPVLCTMQLARRLELEAKSSSLGDCCEALGIEHEHAHSALADARATARLLAAFLAHAPHVGLAELPVRGDLAASSSLPAAPPRAPLVRRQDVGAPSGQASSPVAAGVLRHLPARWRRGEVAPYFDLLRLALEDRVVEPDELRWLVELALECGIPRAEVRQAHEAFLRAAQQAALEAGTATEAEALDLEACGRLLEVAEDELGEVLGGAVRGPRMLVRQKCPRCGANLPGRCIVTAGDPPTVEAAPPSKEGEARTVVEGLTLTVRCVAEGCAGSASAELAPWDVFARFYGIEQGRSSGAVFRACRGCGRVTWVSVDDWLCTEPPQGCHFAARAPAPAAPTADPEQLALLPSAAR